MYKNNHFLASAIGISALAGMVAYLSMPQKSQREWESNLKKTIHDLTDIVEEIGDGIRSAK